MKALFFLGRQFFDISMQKLILVFVSLIVHNQVVLRDQDAPRRVGHVLWTDPVPFDLSLLTTLTVVFLCDKRKPSVTSLFVNRRLSERSSQKGVALPMADLYARCPVASSRSQPTRFRFLVCQSDISG